MIDRYKRAPHLLTRWFHGDAFVITPVAIENLSGVSAVVWRRLTRACSQNEVAAQLIEQHPEVEPQTISADVNRLFLEFKQRGLVVKVSAAAARKAARRRSTRR